MCTAMADFEGVIHYMGDVIRLGEESGNQVHIAMALEHVSSSLALMAQFDQAWDKVQEALSVQRAIGDREHEAWALTTTVPLILATRSDLDGALVAAEDGVRIGDRIGSVGPQVYGNWFLTEIHRWRGDYELALEFGRRALEASLPVEPYAPFMTVQPLGALGMVYLGISRRFLAEISRFHLHALRLLETPVGAIGGGTAWADLGWCAQALGDLEGAETFLQKGLDQPSMYMVVERPRNLAGLALVRLAQGRPDEALALVNEARDLAAARRMGHVLPLLNLTAGRIHAGRGEVDQALGALRQATGAAQVMRMRPIVWQAQVEMARLLAAAGRAAEAEEVRRAGRAAAAEIAARFREDDLRAAYLATAEV
jgi:tetratricopeptide (TPR) repeat protein